MKIAITTADSQHLAMDTGLQTDLLDNIEAGIIVLDAAVTILGWNHWMTQHTGLLKPVVLNRSFLDVFQNITTQRISQCITTCLRFGHSAILSTALNPFPLPLFEPKRLAQSPNAPGERIHQSITIKPLLDSKGIRHCVLQILDVTPAYQRERLLREQSEKANTSRIEAEKASKIKSEFTSMVSHELRTPLTAIQGALKLISGGVITDAPETIASLLDIAYRNTDRLLLLINDLLDVHKIEAGKFHYDYRRCEMLELLKQALSANKPYADKYAVHFVLSPLACSAVVDIDLNRIQQVVTNLLSNAAKFSPPASDIIIDCQVRNTDLVVSISDKGTGVPLEFRERIFERFAQADASNTRRSGGTGLGLCISREIITQHRGKMWFESEPGHGASFYFSLPLAAVNLD